MASFLVLYQSIALVATNVPANPPNTAQGGSFQPLNPIVLNKPFSAAEQQFQALPLNQPPRPVDAQFQRKQDPDVFVKPFPAAQQQWSSFEPAGFIKTTFPDGFAGVQWDLQFKKPFPVTEQQYAVNDPVEQVPTAPTPHGWEGQQLEVRFSKPFPVTAQQYISAGQTRQVPTAVTPYGWWGIQYDIEFAKPFPVTQQQFSVWDLVGDVPPFLPPGSGRRYKPPFDYLPDPPYEAKPNKPFRPVWDKPKQGVVEQPKAAPQGPPPLPPAELFGTPGQAGSAKALAPAALKLPSFVQYAPEDPLGLSRRMGEVQDKNDAIAVLKKLGLMRDNNEG